MVPPGNIALILPLLAKQSEESIFKLNGIFGCTVIVTVSVALHGPLAAEMTYFHTPTLGVTVMFGIFVVPGIPAPALGIAVQFIVVPAPPVTVADRFTFGGVAPVTQ